MIRMTGRINRSSFWLVCGLVSITLAAPLALASGDSARTATEAARSVAEKAALPLPAAPAGSNSAAAHAVASGKPAPALATGFTRTNFGGTTHGSNVLSSGLRDPFRDPDPPALRVAIGKPVPAHRPPGVRGLEVGHLRLQGIVQEEVSHNMIAMVTNGTHLSYFLHENQRLYDGVVTRITRNELHLRYDGSGSNPKDKSKEVVLKIAPVTGPQS
jgi:hypothetical protein